MFQKSYRKSHMFMGFSFWAFFKTTEKKNLSSLLFAVSEYCPVHCMHAVSFLLSFLSWVFLEIPF